jgi:regulator of sigma E protease
MAINLIYILLAILGLSFLIFIHELGHYWMARRVGMRVETFAIGFGKPIYSWVRKGVTWQIGWLPFGGYVKIAGTDTTSMEDPYRISDGFFGKKPWDRIKVSFMGPFVNLLFALIVFSMLWVVGGREKSFSEFSGKIGWIDPHSELYALGIRPGDEIVDYDNYKFQSSKDHIYAPMITSSSEMSVKGMKYDYEMGAKEPFQYLVKPYAHPNYYDKNISTSGIFNSASYVIYDRLPGGAPNPLPEGSPLSESGIEYGDRILWIDGEIIFSNAELSELLNNGRVLITIERDNKTLLRRVPRVLAKELRPDPEFREELIDWLYEAGLNPRFQDLFVIPYNLTYNCVVEEVLRFIDKENQEEAFPENLFSTLEESLQPGDKIIAVQGQPVSFSYELLQEIQEKKVNIIVQRDPFSSEVVSWKDADNNFNQNLDLEELNEMASTIGTDKQISNLGMLSLLNPVIPKARVDFSPMSSDAKAWLAAEKNEKRTVIEKVEDPQKKAHLLNLLDVHDRLLVLGLPNPQDRKVVYNPKPTDLFSNVAREIWRTLQALFSGSLSPKYITGPIGIVQVVQSTSMVSFKEAFFWIGAISLNLGMLNLLPIPVLDGGTILLSLFEMVSGKKIKPKALEKVIIFFAMLLIAFFIFLTYNDILRVFNSFL